nr:unnamed protein product [Callosobruchus analis]
MMFMDASNLVSWYHLYRISMNISDNSSQSDNNLFFTRTGNTMLFTNNDTIESSLEQHVINQIHRSLQTNNDRITTFVLGDLETDILRPLFYLSSSAQRTTHTRLLLLVCGVHSWCSCGG